jgi:hypothetical protein
MQRREKRQNGWNELHLMEASRKLLTCATSSLLRFVPKVLELVRGKGLKLVRGAS